MNNIDTMKWVPLDEAVEVIKSLHRLDWIVNFNYKYLKIHIDTRDKGCLIMDRDCEVISQETYDSWKDKSYIGYEKHFNR